MFRIGSYLCCVLACASIFTAGCSLKDTPYIPIAENVYGVPPLSCPGIQMAATCGNGSCDDVRLETAETCPEDCTQYNVRTNNRIKLCTETQTYAEPTTIAELSDAVVAAVKAGRRIRFTGTHHSINELICGDGATISTQQLHQIYGVTDGIVTVQPGVKIGELGDYLDQQGLSLGYAHIGWRGITVAGSIGTSAHGSAPFQNTILANRVKTLKIMDQTGQITAYSEATTDAVKWGALLSNMGMLGAVVEVGLQTEPQFNLATTITVLEESALFTPTGVLGLATGCGFFQVNWMPSANTVLAWCGAPTNAAAEPGAQNGLLGGAQKSITAIQREVFHLSTCYKSVGCDLENKAANVLKSQPPLLKEVDGVLKPTFSAVGPSHRMVSGNYSLGGGPYGDPSLTLRTNDWEVAVPQQHIQDVLTYVKNKLATAQKCLPPIGMFLRFGLIEEGSLLSNAGAGGDFVAGQTAMFFEMPAVDPYGAPSALVDEYNQFYKETIEELIALYGARAHWGKNPDEMFSYQLVQGRFAAELATFQTVVAEMDPLGVFHNKSAEVLGITAPQQGVDFASYYFPSEPNCGCDVDAAPVCNHLSGVDYTNTCRALCAGELVGNLTAGACNYVF